MTDNSGPVNADWTIVDVLSEHPETERIFRQLEAQTGVCICCEGLFLSIREAAAQFHFDLQAALDAIEGNLRRGSASRAQYARQP